MTQYIKDKHPEINWWCPQLPPSPKQACELISNRTKSWPADKMAVIGSSLGGFYATWLAEQKQCKAVLLNPAIDPYQSLKNHVGVLSTWQNPNDTFIFSKEYVDELHDFYIDKPTKPERYFAIIAKGDEVLDWQESTKYFDGVKILLLPESDHGLSDFPEYIPQLLKFLAI